MLTTSCDCGKPKNPNAKHCWSCANEARRLALQGRQYSPERRANIRAGRLKNPTRFDIGSTTRGKAARNAVEVGYRRLANGHYQVKCADGRFRYEHRVVWEAAHGPIPPSILIHHINHDPLDNRLDNLVAFTRSEHMRHHIEERAGDMQRAAVAVRNARKAAGGKY